MCTNNSTPQNNNPWGCVTTWRGKAQLDTCWFSWYTIGSTSWRHPEQTECMTGSTTSWLQTGLCRRWSSAMRFSTKMPPWVWAPEMPTWRRWRWLAWVRTSSWLGWRAPWGTAYCTALSGFPVCRTPRTSSSLPGTPWTRNRAGKRRNPARNRWRTPSPASTSSVWRCPRSGSQCLALHRRGPRRRSALSSACPSFVRFDIEGRV